MDQKLEGLEGLRPQAQLEDALSLGAAPEAHNPQVVIRDPAAPKWPHLWVAVHFCFSSNNNFNNEIKQV